MVMTKRSSLIRMSKHGCEPVSQSNDLIQRNVLKHRLKQNASESDHNILKSHPLTNGTQFEPPPKKSRLLKVTNGCIETGMSVTSSCPKRNAFDLMRDLLQPEQQLPSVCNEPLAPEFEADLPLSASSYQSTSPCHMPSENEPTPPSNAYSSSPCHLPLEDEATILPNDATSVNPSHSYSENEAVSPDNVESARPSHENEMHFENDAGLLSNVYSTSPSHTPSENEHMPLAAFCSLSPSHIPFESESISHDNAIDSISDGYLTSKNNTILPDNVYSLGAQEEDYTIEEYHEQVSVKLEVTETYQLGFRIPVFRKGKKRSIIHFPACIEAVEVTYPLHCQLDSVGQPQIPVDFPPLFLSSDYQKELRKLVRKGLTSIQEELDHFYNDQLSKHCHSWIATQLQCYDETVCLRKLVFRLLLKIFPDIDMHPNFDCTTPHVDSLLDAICRAFDSSDNERAGSPLNKLKMTPIVHLFSDTQTGLRSFKETIFKTLCLMLPDLKVPDAFTIEGDISDLLQRVISCS